MKKFIITSIVFLFSLTNFAQEIIKYKNSDNTPIEFKISPNEYFVKINNNRQKQALKRNNFISNILEINKNSIIIENNQILGKFNKRKRIISSNLKINSSNIEPVLIYKDGVKQIFNGEIIIKLKNKNLIYKLFSDYKIEITSNKLFENQFIIKIKGIDTFDVFQIVSNLQNNPDIDFIEPNFIRLIKPYTNDPFLNSQWAINNQGYLGGTVDADMDVDSAWNISTGFGVKVAVIDEGVDLNHNDLTQNLLSGYDATGNNSNGAPNIFNNDAHGTNCAGIIAASANNNIGIAGIAYNAKIIPVRIAYNNNYPIGDYRRQWVTNTSWIVAGIYWAYQNGADILSNSWGGGSESDAITTAVNNAITYGRNGKGCIVLFASGNKNLSSVSFPSSLNNVISVGASSMCDERKSPRSCDGENWWGSNYGSGLDIVAPGVKIYSTDISGSHGYTFGDYFSNFNGTSSACPQAAGVVALILSVNPTLTYNQVREILEKTTDKISNYNYQNNFNHPNGSWNREVGYGRINAYNAVLETLSHAQILGDNSSCNNTTYSLLGVPNNVPVSWVTSSNLNIISNTNTSITVSPINNNISENGFIEAHFQGNIKRKNIWVGKSKLIKTKTGSCYEPIYHLNATFPDKALEFKISHNGNIQYYSGSTYHVSDYNLQDGQSTTIYVNIRNNCGWSQTYPITIYKPTLCDCGYDNPSCGGSDGPPTVLDASHKDISIYPIPTRDVLNIYLGNTKVSFIKLISYTGQIIDKLIPMNNIIRYDVSKYSNGIYLLEIVTNDKIILKKISINH